MSVTRHEGVDGNGGYLSRSLIALDIRDATSERSCAVALREGRKSDSVLRHRMAKCRLLGGH